MERKILNFHPNRDDARGLQKNQRALEEHLYYGRRRDAVLDSAVGSFSIGDLLNLSGGGWALADNTDRTRRAEGVVRSLDGSGYVVTMSRGEIFEWKSHGLGSAGQRLWLGTSGGYVTSEPVGSGIQVVQEVALVVDDDSICLFPDAPPTF